MGKIAITTSAGWESFPLPERLCAYREAGFDSVMLWLGREIAGMSPEEQFALVRKAGAEVENCHGDYRGINSLWFPCDEGDRFTDMCLGDIEACARHGVSTYVFHLSSGLPPPTFSAIGQNRLETLVLAAEKCGVRIAFENLRHRDLLEVVMPLFSSPYVGFCYDSGHQHCFTPDVDWLSLYGDRLLAVHLHDNDGKKDAHLLPGDGSICFSTLCARLKTLNFRQAVGIETDAFLPYAAEGLDFGAFLRRAYRAGEQIRQAIYEI